MSNLANGRVMLEFNNFLSVPKSSSSLYSNLIFYFYLVYELNNWLRNPTSNCPLKHCPIKSGTVRLVRNGIKSEFTYNVLGIVFDGEGSCSFGNDFANVVIFGVVNSWSSHNDNQKKLLFIIRCRTSWWYYDSTGAAKKILTLEKQIQNFVFKFTLQWW